MATPPRTRAASPAARAWCCPGSSSASPRPPRCPECAPKSRCPPPPPPSSHCRTRSRSQTPPPPPSPAAASLPSAEMWHSGRLASHACNAWCSDTGGRSALGLVVVGMLGLSLPEYTSSGEITMCTFPSISITKLATRE